MWLHQQAIIEDAESWGVLGLWYIILCCLFSVYDKPEGRYWPKIADRWCAFTCTIDKTWDTVLFVKHKLAPNPYEWIMKFTSRMFFATAIMQMSRGIPLSNVLFSSGQHLGLGHRWICFEANRSLDPYQTRSAFPFMFLIACKRDRPICMCRTPLRTTTI